MEADTVFDLASLTKIFTTTAILRLATIGRLDLDSALCDIIGFAEAARGALSRESFGCITIRSLLLHSSGLHYWYPFYAAGKSDFFEILESVLGRFPLREGTVYSDLNFMLLGKAIEYATGLPLEAAMRDLVILPLGLGGASFGKPSAQGLVAATEFGNRIERAMVEELGLSFDGWRDESRAISGEPDDGNCHYYFKGVAGHAGIFARAEDVCLLGDLYAAGPTACAERGLTGYLSQDLAQAAGHDCGMGRGLGFQAGELYPQGGFGHSGFTGTWLYANPRLELSLAVLTNRLHTEKPVNINAFRKKLAEIFLQNL
jgi:CubicO group peptidase (beta-lactamase class C family)